MNLIERLELVLDESRRNDDMALAKLVKAGVDKTIAPEVLKALGAITVDGGDNSKRVVDMSKNGKDIIPLAVWMGTAWDANDTLELNINKVADQVHRKGAMPALENVDFTSIMTNNGGEEGTLDTLDKLTAWLDKQGAKTKNVSKGGSGYNFPKKMLAYSDKYVDCYRANTPTEAMMLGSGYPFCISRRDGSNFFYSYRMNPTTTTVYFCWFKDEYGNKSHDDMVVVHVGDDGKYMVTQVQNGNFPRDSKATTIEKYPRLKGAIESGKLTVVPMSDEELFVRQNFNARSIVLRNVFEGKSPKYIELVIAQGVKLADDAFDYIFEEVDKGNLRTGNNGNSLIKKYIESGVHKLSKHQKEVLEKSGYEHEVYRNLKVWWKGRLALDREEPMTLEVFDYFIKHGDLDTDDSVLLEYISKNGFSDEILERVKDLPEKQRKQIRVAIVRHWLDGGTYPHTLSNTKVVLENDKMVVRGTDERIVLKYIESVVYVDKIEGIKRVIFKDVNFDRVLSYNKKLLEIQEGAKVEFEKCIHIDLSLFGNAKFEHIEVHEGAIKGGSASSVGAKSYMLSDYVHIEDNVINFPKEVENVILSQVQLDYGGKINWPRKLTNLDVSYASRLYSHSGFAGITEEITGVFNFGTVGLSIKHLKGFPKRINKLVLHNINWDGEVPKLIQDSKIGTISIVEENVYRDRGGMQVKNFREDDTKVLEWIASHQGVSKLKSQKQQVAGTWYEEGIKVEDKGDYYNIEVKNDYFGLNNTPDKPIHLLKYELDSKFISWARNPISGSQHRGCYYYLGNIVDLDALPYQFETNFDDVGIDIWDTLRDTLRLTHEVKGASYLLITRSPFLKKVEGLENIKGLIRVVIVDCPNLDLSSIKVAKGVSLDTASAKHESIPTLHTVLNALSEEDAPVGDAGTGSTTGSGTVGNGTVSDLGEVPEPKLALLNVPYKRRKKGIKGLIALLSNKSGR